MLEWKKCLAALLSDNDEWSHGTIQMQYFIFIFNYCNPIWEYSARECSLKRLETSNSGRYGD